MKAVLKNGLIHPKEPVPADWPEGTEVDVEKAPSATAGDALDQWYVELETACAQMDPDDDQVLKEAIREVRNQEKNHARKDAGLPG